MISENLRYFIILAYMIGNALTFNSLIKAERAAMVAGESWWPAVLKTLALALVWPLYWVARLFGL